MPPARHFGPVNLPSPKPPAPAEYSLAITPLLFLPWPVTPAATARRSRLQIISPLWRTLADRGGELPFARNTQAMKKSRKITVRVTPDLYRQTRHLAANYDITVTAMVEYLLKEAPRALATTRYHRECLRKTAPEQTPSPVALPLGRTLPPTSSESENPRCSAVRAASCCVSEASSPQPSACTPAVPLYIAPNQHNPNGLQANRKICTAVVQRLFRHLSKSLNIRK